MKLKHLIAILAACTTLTITGIEIFYNNKISELEYKRIKIILNLNTLLLESHDKAFRTIGRQVDAIGFLFEHRNEEYDKLIDQAEELINEFDNYYIQYQSDQKALDKVDKKIKQYKKYSLVKSIPLLLALLILGVSAFNTKEEG